MKAITDTVRLCKLSRLFKDIYICCTVAGWHDAGAVADRVHVETKPRRWNTELTGNGINFGRLKAGCQWPSSSNKVTPSNIHIHISNNNY